MRPELKNVCSAKTMLYRVEGLPVLDCLVLDSLLRLVSRRQGVHWHRSNNKCVDVLVRPRKPTAGTEVAEVEAQIAILTSRDHENDLKVPFRLGDVEQRFDITLASLRSAHATNQDPARRAVPGTSSGASAFDATATYRLLRWPDRSLLGHSPEYPRIAALMSRRPVRFDKLVDASATSAACCEAFLSLALQSGHVRLSSTQNGMEALHSAGAEFTPQGASASANKAADLQVSDRFFSADLVGVAPASALPSGLSLFSRIRDRVVSAVRLGAGLRTS